MNEDFPPRALPTPIYRQRRADKPQMIPLSPALRARRGEAARVLGVKVDGLNQHLKSLTEAQRKAVFYKVTHDGPVSLIGTGLKPLVDKSRKVTLAVPGGVNLDSFAEKLTALAAAPDDEDFAPNQHLARIEGVEQAAPKDRLSDELLASYDTLVNESFVICEVEILSIAQGKNQRQNEISSVLLELNNAFAHGIHGTLFEQDTRDGICRAVIRATGDMFRRLVEEDKWQRAISWFEPRPRFETFQTVWSDFAFDNLMPIEHPPDDAPTICVVDSGVSPGNPFLEPVTREELLKSFLKHAPDNPFDENGHGSGVASLAAYHSLDLSEGGQNKARAWIASARILAADNQIEEDRLYSKLLEEVVAEFAPQRVRIFNLSVADLSRKWNQDEKRTQPRTSWTARTIDRLSRDHDVVFVVSTGNIPMNEIRDYLQEGSTYPAYLCDDNSRILDPGQAGLALSVGSIAPGALVTSSPDTAIAQEYEPSPFTRSGPGIKGDIKPELVEFGGNLIRDQETHSVRANASTNVVMASHKLTPAVSHEFGTSFATPRVAHKLAVLLQELQELGIDHPSAPLLKAFIVNSASYRGDLNEVVAKLDEVARDGAINVLGYGFPEPSRATDCDDYSILLYHQGQIEPNQVAFFSIPVPVVLTESSDRKRLSVTVAHYPEVQKWGLENYFGVDLKWRVFRGDVDRDSVVNAMSTGDDENADRPDLPNELAFEHRITRRSRGTVQHDSFEWTEHKHDFSSDHYTLAVAASPKWNRNRKPEQPGYTPSPYAIVVRLEDLGGTVHVYNQVIAELDILIEEQIES